VKEHLPRVGPLVSIKTPSQTQAMEPAAEAVAAQRLKSQDHISGVVTSRRTNKRETNLTHVLRKIDSSSVTRIDDIEADPRFIEGLAGRQSTRKDWRDQHEQAQGAQLLWYTLGTGGLTLGRTNGNADTTWREMV
jgi:hypothetical protein